MGASRSSKSKIRQRHGRFKAEEKTSAALHFVICPFCHKVFQTRRKNAVYCCRAHYNKDYYERNKDSHWLKKEGK